jgi:hypothetical protein
MQPTRARRRPRAEQGPARASAAPEEAHHGTAMLQLALELKKPGAPSFDVLVAQLAYKMRLHEPSFRSFLAQQGDLFTALATGRG